MKGKKQMKIDLYNSYYVLGDKNLEKKTLLSSVLQMKILKSRLAIYLPCVIGRTEFSTVVS